MLVADDTEEARRLIRRILQSQGSFTITEAIDGWQAVEHANQDPPDLIILDLMMPELDGFAVLDELKANPRTRRYPGDRCDRQRADAWRRSSAWVVESKP